MASRGGVILASLLVGVVSRDIDASEQILDFFLRHSRDEHAVSQGD